MAEVEHMAEQIEDLLVDIKDNLSRLSRVRDGLKALKVIPCVENIKQIPQAVICEAQPNFDAAYYAFSGSGSVVNTKTEETTSFQWSSIQSIKDKPPLTDSVICEPRPSYAAASIVAKETSETKEEEDIAKNWSASREIMMMLDGKEVNIIATRPQLIKKSRPKLIKK